jgi:uncharacterized protein (TIGR02452 family)
MSRNGYNVEHHVSDGSIPPGPHDLPSSEFTQTIDAVASPVYDFHGAMNNSINPLQNIPSHIDDIPDPIVHGSTPDPKSHAQYLRPSSASTSLMHAYAAPPYYQTQQPPHYIARQEYGPHGMQQMGQYGNPAHNMQQVSFIAGPPSSSSSSSSSSISGNSHALSSHQDESASKQATQTKSVYPSVDRNVRYSIDTISPYKPWNYMKFMPRRWQRLFHDYERKIKNRNDFNALCCRVMRIHIMCDTIESCARQQYPGDQHGMFKRLMEITEKETSSVLNFDDLCERTSSTNQPPLILPIKDVKLMVVNGDTLDVALLCKQYRLKTCCLNMGNTAERGGGYLSGAAAQEESMFRRTNLYYRLGGHEKAELLEDKVMTKDAIHPHWTPSHANGPIDQTSTIYTKDAIVFRESETNGYAFMTEPTIISILTACALQRSKESRSQPLSNQERETTIQIIQSILGRAVLEGCDCIVLGALGCGAFNNPPTEIANLFKQVLYERFYAQFFRFIVFAIIEDHNSKGMNLDPFCSTFESFKKKRQYYDLDSLKETLGKLSKKQWESKPSKSKEQRVVPAR